MLTEMKRKKYNRRNKIKFGEIEEGLNLNFERAIPDENVEIRLAAKALDMDNIN
jgi:hypothetical protein